MPGVIQRRPEGNLEGDEELNQKPVYLRLDRDDRQRLRELCKLGNTNMSDVLRQCLRYVHELETRESHAKPGAA